MLSSNVEPPFLANGESLANFIAQFERGTWPKPQWTHAAHLAVAAWYLHSLSVAEATERVRAGIKSYNEAVGTRNTEDSGYHETLTLFWMGIVSERLSRDDRRVGILEAVRMVVTEFGAQRDLYRDYYSFDVVKSREARAKWVRPDRLQNFHGNKSGLGRI